MDLERVPVLEGYGAFDRATLLSGFRVPRRWGTWEGKSVVPGVERPGKAHSHDLLQVVHVALLGSEGNGSGALTASAGEGGCRAEAPSGGLRNEKHEPFG